MPNEQMALRGISKLINLRLDVNKQNESNPIVFLRVGDGNLDGLNISVLDSGAPLDLSTMTISFEGVTSSGKTIIDTALTNKDLKNGKFTYVFPEQSSQSEGEYRRAYFSFVKDNQRLTTQNFEICVYGSVELNEINPENYINPYNDLIAKLQGAFNNSTTSLNEQVDMLGMKISDYINGRTVDFIDFKTQFAQLVDNVKAEVSTLQGPQGPAGSTGPAGLPGPKGDPGTSIAIKGSVADEASLPTTGVLADGYLIGTDLYIYDGSKWINEGPVRGPIGLTGSTGKPGKDGQTGPKGDPGQGIELKGAVNDISELPTVATDGSAYLIGTKLYVWFKLNWNLTGDLQGPKGEKGESGVTQDISNCLKYDPNTGDVTVAINFTQPPTVNGNVIPVYESVTDEDAANELASSLKGTGYVGLIGWTEA